MAAPFLTVLVKGICLEGRVTRLDKQTNEKCQDTSEIFVGPSVEGEDQEWESGL